MKTATPKVSYHPYGSPRKIMGWAKSLPAFCFTTLMAVTATAQIASGTTGYQVGFRRSGYSKAQRAGVMDAFMIRPTSAFNFPEGHHATCVSS